MQDTGRNRNKDSNMDNDMNNNINNNDALVAEMNIQTFINTI